MEPTIENNINAATSRAWEYIQIKDYDNAELHYRDARKLRIDNEGVDAALRETYNLSFVLVEQQKFEPAEEMLDQLTFDLAQRQSGRETSNFMQQEAGAARLLQRACEGLGNFDKAATARDEVSMLEQKLLNLEQE